MSVYSRMDRPSKTPIHLTKPNTEAILQSGQTNTLIKQWFLQAILYLTFLLHRRISTHMRTPQCHTGNHLVMIRIIIISIASQMFHQHRRLSTPVAKMNQLMRKHSSRPSLHSMKIAICHFHTRSQLMEALSL